jgi:transmembrane sensor
MTVDPQPGLEDELREQAVAWVVRLSNEPSAADLQRFDQWRQQSDQHECAFEIALSAWISVGEHATAPNLLAMRRDALERARRTQRRWDWRAIAAVVSLVILAPVIGAVWYQFREPAEQQFQTAHGEQRVIVLPDGSRMSLDARTDVRVRYTPDVRNMELIAGRANFEVAKDVTRPLKVRAGPRTVTALGTVFTVERESRNVVVTLMEGGVAVTSRDKPNSHFEMRPRQELRMTDGGEVALRDGIDPAQALAWREGKLVFEDEPLRNVVARMNNYGATSIVVVGKASELRVGGVFKAGDTNAFVDAMQSYFPLSASHESQVVTLQLKEPPVEQSRTH